MFVPYVGQNHFAKMVLHRPLPKRAYVGHKSPVLCL